MPATAQTEPALMESCRRIHFERPPEWVNSVFWIPELSEIMVTDNRRNEMTTHTLYGSLGGSPRAWPADDPVPYSMAKLGADYLVINSTSTKKNIEWWDRELVPRRPPLDLGRAAGSGHWRIQSIWGSQVTTAGSSLVAMGGLRPEYAADDEKVGEWLGVFAYELPAHGGAENGSLRPLYPFLGRIPREVEPLYRMDLPMLAGIESKVFFLAYEKRPRLYVYDLSTSRAEELAGLPELDERFSGLDDFDSRLPAPIYSEVERRDLYVGLYAAADKLYLLRRTPRRAGDTLWRVYQLTPRPGYAQVEGAVVLPTTSAHIYPVPAGGKWLVVEQGRPEHVSSRYASLFDPQEPKKTAYLEQVFHASTALVLPGGAISDPQSSPLRDRGTEELPVRCLDTRPARE